MFFEKLRIMVAKTVHPKWLIFEKVHEVATKMAL
jgi:hypothetical protein